jgi:hypothetical protein
MSDSLAWQDDELARSLTRAIGKGRAVEAGLYGQLTTAPDDDEHIVSDRAIDPYQGCGGHERPAPHDDLAYGLSKALNLPMPRRYGA